MGYMHIVRWRQLPCVALKIPEDSWDDNKRDTPVELKSYWIKHPLMVDWILKLWVLFLLPELRNNQTSHSGEESWFVYGHNWPQKYVPEVVTDIAFPSTLKQNNRVTQSWIWSSIIKK
jgi:hypothetical protein